MKKLILIIMIGSLLAQDDNAASSDKLILISGDSYKGLYYSEDNNFIYFKPTGWIVEQGVEKYKILSVILSDGTIIFDNNNSLRPTWSYNKPKDPFKAGLLSILFPSGGHYYNEEYDKGIVFIASTIITLGVGIGFNRPDREPEIGTIFLLASPIIHYISTINAIKSSQKINELYYKEYVKEQNVKSNN